MKQKFIDLYMDWATRVAQLSYARRLQVGAVIVKDDCVISYGYNGMPAGWDNVCEDEIPLSPWPAELPEELDNTYTLKTKPEVIHAERNALDKLAKQGGIGGQNATMFVTHAPCIECAKSIYSVGITEVFYREDYRSEDGIYFLKKCGIKIVKISKGDK
jgi:dCMP deaminase